MTAFRFLAVLCFAVMIVLVIGDRQCIRGCRGRDGRNGRDGRDGRNGRDGRDLRFETFHRPSIHLDGTAKGIHLVMDRDIDIWRASGANGHVSGGMMYANGQITVPVAGIYFVYCQVYYIPPNKAGRHALMKNHRRVALAGTQDVNPTTGTYYTGLSLKMNKGDKLSCRNEYNSYVYGGMMHTFFGAFLQ